MRAGLDPNVLISAAISRKGAPAAILRHAELGDFELVISPQLLGEFDRALKYPKVRDRIDADRQVGIVNTIRLMAWEVADPGYKPSVPCPDPKDEYLISLVEEERIALVTGDKALQALAPEIPVFSPAQFLELLRARG